MDGQSKTANGTIGLKDVLHDMPLVFEPAPPARSGDASTTRADKIIGLLRGISRLDAVNVPELIDVNHDGKPYYRSGDIVAFASRIANAIGKDAIVNKVVVHLNSEEEFQRWLSETKSKGIDNIVIVGGASRHIRYPGPSVMAANMAAMEMLRNDGSSLIGNITIPQREGEAARMLEKTKAGARFFTTQLLFESDSIIGLLREYGHLCEQHGVRPATVLLSFAPLSDSGDIDFARWLGAEIPEDAEEKMIVQGRHEESAGRSIENAEKIWKRVTAERKEHHVEVPVGINVEEISKHNLDAAIRMLTRFAEVLECRTHHGDMPPSKG